MSALDQPIETILSLMEKVINQGGKAYIKWTCPKCGDRCCSDRPNEFNAGGYLHTEREDGTPCGGVYQGTMFGLRAVHTFPGEGGAPH